LWLRDAERRTRLLDAMREVWRSDLEGDGFTPQQIEKRLARGDLLRRAPELIVPFLVPDGAHKYPDQRRAACEHTMFTVAGGAAVQALLVALAAEGLGSCWVGSTIFAAPTAREVLRLDDGWYPLGAVAVGRPAPEAGDLTQPRPPHPVDEGLIELWACTPPLSTCSRHGARRHTSRSRCARPTCRSWPPARTPALARARPGTSRPRRWCSTTTAATCCSRCIRASGGGCSSAVIANRTTSH